MAGTKISALAALTTVADGDLLPIVDVSDPGSGTTKQVTASNVAAYVAVETAAFVYAATYGAIGDGTNEAAKLQAAVDAAEALVGASSLDIRVCVELGLGKNYRVNGNSVVLPKGVYIHGNGSKIQALTAGTIIKLEGYQSGVEHATIFGVNGATDNLGIHMSSTAGGGRQVVRDVHFDTLGGRAILCEAIASWIEDCVAQNGLLLDAALATPTGVCELNTTDCWITNSEFTASNTAMSASGFAYAVVVKGGTHQLQGVIAEISDGGFYISATRSRYSVCRADLNRGHGWTFATGATGQLVGCSSLRNGLETTNTYDGFNFAVDTRFQVSTCTAESLTADGVFHRYGFNDATQGASNFNQYDSTNLSILAATAPIKVEDVAGAKVTCADGPFISAAAAATTIDVQQYGWPQTRWRLLSVAPVNFTDFTNHVTGMRISVLGDGFTTFVNNGAVLRTKTGGNTLAAANTIYEFVNNSGIWYEVTNSVAALETEWIGPESFLAGAGTPALYAFGGGTSYFHAWLMDAAADEGVSATRFIPNEWLTYAVDLWWTNQAAGAGDVRWGGQQYQVVDAGVMTTLDRTMTAVVVTAPVAATIKVTTLDTAVPNLGGALTLLISRFGTHASDTLANDAALIGINLRRLT